MLVTLLVAGGAEGRGGGAAPSLGVPKVPLHPGGPPTHRSTSPLWMSVFILSVKCSTLACQTNHQHVPGLLHPSHIPQIPPELLRSLPRPRFPSIFSPQRCRQRSPGAAHLQVVDGEGVFVHVGGVGAHRDAGDGGQVPAVAAHGLHDEDAALGARRRLLDAVAALLRDKIGDGVTQAEPAGGERGTPRRCPSPPWLR